MIRVLAIALSTLAALQLLFVIVGGYVIAALPNVDFHAGNVLADLVVTAILFGLLTVAAAAACWAAVE